MKTKNMILAALSMTAALVMTACSSDDNMVEAPATPQAEVKTIPYTVTVGQGGDAATTRATVDGDNITLRFATGDKLYITGTNVKGVLEITSGVGEASDATFSGDLTYTGEGSPADDLLLTATLVSAQQTVGSEVSVDAAGAVTVNYPTTAYCDDVATAVQKYSNLTGTSPYGSKSFDLTQQTAFLNFVITFTEGTETGTAFSTVVSNNGSAVCTANVTTVTDEGVKAKFVLPVAGGTALNGATVTMGKKPALTITNASLTGKVYNVQRTQAVKIVDLGLPSGTKWASMNVGATSETDRGLFFAWGATRGYSSSESHDFTWSNTPFYTGNGSTHSWSKYTASGSTLEPADDAATANWGSNWRMPTHAEQEELVNNTDKEWTTINGVNGYKFKKKSAPSIYIFLPVTGYRSTSHNNTHNGYYWASTLYSKDKGHYLYLTSTNNGEAINSPRYPGACVRAVQKN